MHVHYISIHDGRKNKMIWALFSVHWRRVENSILCTSFIRSLAENSAHLIFGPLCFGPSVLWRCWWGGRKGIRPVKKLSGGVLAQFLICLEQVADLHMSQLMPLPLTVSCFSKIQIGFTFLVPAHPGSPGKRAVKRVCVWSNNWQFGMYKWHFTVFSICGRCSHYYFLFVCGYCLPQWKYRGIKLSSSQVKTSLDKKWVQWVLHTQRWRPSLNNPVNWA